MKTLFVAYRVTDLDRSLGFYTALGYVELGRVEVGEGTRLVILKFPGEPAASLELVHRPASARIDVGNGFDHLAIQVDTLATTLETLAEAGLVGPLGAEAAIIGEVTADPPGIVLMKTRVGGTRIVDVLSGEQLPRIC